MAGSSAMRSRPFFVPESLAILLPRASFLLVGTGSLLVNTALLLSKAGKLLAGTAILPVTTASLLPGAGKNEQKTSNVAGLSSIIAGSDSIIAARSRKN